ncbi:MAG: hypothetical protein K2Q12_09130 [Rickettsiales bacterium]|nr:hypothetical protein [Rickettsiales bacterium]
MKKHLIWLTSAALFATPVMAEDVKVESDSSIERGDNGSYKAEAETSREDSKGLISRQTTTEVDRDANGDSETTRTTKTVNDPKGLLNKTTTKTEQSSTVEDGKISHEAKKTVDGRTVSKHSENR